MIRMKNRQTLKNQNQIIAATNNVKSDATNLINIFISIAMK